MLCPCWTEKVVNRTEVIFTLNAKGQNVASGTHKVKKADVLICGKKPAVLVRVHYSELHRWRQNEGKNSDVFALCIEHGAEFAEPSKWNIGKVQHRQGSISGQRGVVDFIEVIQGDLEFQAKEDKNLRVMASVKQGIKRTMNQTNTKNLSIDHWRQVFEETLSEWIIEQVQDS